MMDRCECFTDCKTTIPLSFLKVSHLNTIPCGFYESPNEQNRMCECMNPVTYINDSLLCVVYALHVHMYSELINQFSFRGSHQQQKSIP